MVWSLGLPKMAIDNQAVAKRLEVLRFRDAELGQDAETAADKFRSRQIDVVKPYEFPFTAPFEKFYPSFVYVAPHATRRQKKSPIRVLKQRNLFVFVPRHCVISTSLSDVLEKVGDADFAYADSFHFDPADHSMFTHQLRPGWSPERLRGHCYVGDVLIATKKLVKRAGGMKFLATLTSHDRALRLSEIATSPTHLPVLLYGSPIESRNPAVDIEAVKSHCVRIRIDAQVSLCADGAAVKVIRNRSRRPSVCAIMPTRGTQADVFGQRVVLAAHSIQKLRERSTFGEIELVVVVDAETHASAIEEITNSAGGNVSFVTYDKLFNFAEKINVAAVQTDADYLLFVNDDTEIITPEIIDIMLSYFEDPNVGMVAPLLKYEDGTVQSAGHLLNPIPFDLYRGAELRRDAAFGILNVAREVSSAIAAFSMTPRKLFELAGGLSMLFPADYNDIDYCLKLDMLGYRTIFTPHAESFHFESKTRIPGQKSESVALLGKRWQHMIENDQYGNRFLQPFQSLWKSNHDSDWSMREAKGTVGVIS
ncbi:MAG: glycosyltransferase [Ilumatobacteraceae bacterium]|nr:glycosyltransferase [Ilumatobacteraceae bacterium]